MVLALVTCLAVAAAPFWPATGGLVAALVRVLVPVEQTLLLIVPAVAACAAVGWWAGGRLVTAIAWVLLSAWVLGQPLPVESPGYAAIGRGWALLVAAAFGIVSLVVPRMPFFTRALSALGLSCAVALTALLVSGRDPARLGNVMQIEFARRSQASIDAWQRHSETAGWRVVTDRSPDIAARAEASVEQLRDLPGRIAPLVPALLALESLAALGLAWGLYHRLSRVRLGPPLGPLRGFRFSDQLVWGLVVGVTLLVVPNLAPLRAVGANLLLFFGALYALRGLGILRWLAPERVALAVAFGVALLLPLLGVWLLAGVLSGVALVVGLGDTWGDWRNRRARSTT
jgi:hypothetical protein